MSLLHRVVPDCILLLNFVLLNVIIQFRVIFDRRRSVEVE